MCRLLPLVLTAVSLVISSCKTLICCSNSPFLCSAACNRLKKSHKCYTTLQTTWVWPHSLHTLFFLIMWCLVCFHEFVSWVHQWWIEQVWTCLKDHETGRAGMRITTEQSKASRGRKQSDDITHVESRVKASSSCDGSDKPWALRLDTISDLTVRWCTSADLQRLSRCSSALEQILLRSDATPDSKARDPD